MGIVVFKDTGKVFKLIYLWFIAQKQFCSHSTEGTKDLFLSFLDHSN